jgi:predicted DNA-binding protein
MRVYVYLSSLLSERLKKKALAQSKPVSLFVREAVEKALKDETKD